MKTQFIKLTKQQFTAQMRSLLKLCPSKPVVTTMTVLWCKFGPRVNPDFTEPIYFLLPSVFASIGPAFYFLLVQFIVSHYRFRICSEMFYTVLHFEYHSNLVNHVH